jgi:hypothetical protein
LQIGKCKLQSANITSENALAMHKLIPQFAFGTDCRSEGRPSPFVPRPLHVVPSPAVKNHASVQPIHDKALGFRSFCNLKFAIRNMQSKKKKAFSILEVILALAILTGAIAVLGELGHFGFLNAKASQDITRAQVDLSFKTPFRIRPPPERFHGFGYP